jgi:hypothetical protein
MIEIYSNKWTGGYGEEPSRAWIEGLQNIDPRQLKNGVDKCIKKGLSWPPSLPEFIELCQFDSDDIGAPSEQEAYREACHLGKPILQKTKTGPLMEIGREWSHAAIYHAYKAVDGWQFIEDERQKESIFKSKYAQVITRIANGEKLEKPEPTLRLENKNPTGVKTKGNMTAGEDAIKKIRASLSQSNHVKVTKKEPFKIDENKLERLRKLEHPGECRYQYLKRIHGK